MKGKRGSRDCNFLFIERRFSGMRTAIAFNEAQKEERLEASFLRRGWTAEPQTILIALHRFASNSPYLDFPSGGELSFLRRPQGRLANPRYAL